MTPTYIAVLFLLAGTALAMPKADQPDLPKLGAPSVSPSLLEEYFINISKTALVFPDSSSPDGRLLLVDAQFKECLTVWGYAGGNGWAVLNSPCKYGQAAQADNALIWLKHAGDGYINLALKATTCIGTGFNAGSGVYTGDWCSSGSHQFAIIPNGNTFSLVQKETSKCLSTKVNTVGAVNQLIVTNCDAYDNKQSWRACDLTGKNCWPTFFPAA